MNVSNSTFLLRLVVAITLLLHSIPGMLTNGVNDFGNQFLNQVGFAPVGVPLAWAIKISHIVAAFCFLFEKYVKPAALVTILVLVVGIVMVHAPNGWFVVGGGRNGVEFNVLLIAVLITLMYPNGLGKK